MPRYYVRLPAAGFVECEVEAANEEEAIEKALTEGEFAEGIQEWEVMENINRGNVCYAPFWDAEAEEME